MKHTTAFDSFHGEAHTTADMAELIAGYEAAELEHGILRIAAKSNWLCFI